MSLIIGFIVYVVIGAIVFGIAFDNDHKPASNQELAITLFLWPIVFGVAVGMWLSKRNKN